MVFAVALAQEDIEEIRRLIREEPAAVKLL